MKLQQGRYLVTGGAGFIGSHLCEALIEQGSEVIAVDNFITGSRDNLRGLLKNSRFSFIEQDVISPLEIEAPLTGIFHLASPASPVDYLRHPIETLRTGSLGSDQVLQLALKKRCRILVASTSEVYGDPLEHPQKETYWGNVNPIGPRGCYDESKRYLEAITMAYHRSYQVDTRIIRIFNTYGPRMRTNDGRVVPNFCMQALEGSPITIYGDGEQTRSFCYVDDLVRGIFTVFAKAGHEPVNLGNPDEYPIVEFAKQILKMVGKSSELVYKPLPQDDPRTRKPDITRARALGWEPEINLSQGLKKTIDYFRTKLPVKTSATASVATLEA